MTEPEPVSRTRAFWERLGLPDLVGTAGHGHQARAGAQRRQRAHGDGPALPRRAPDGEHVPEGVLERRARTRAHARRQGREVHRLHRRPADSLEPPPGDADAVGHVLGRFGPSEREWIEKRLDRAVEAINYALRAGVAQAMNVFNRHDDPPAAPASPATNPESPSQ